MNSRSITGLAVAVIAVAGLSYMTNRSRETAVASTDGGGPLLPVLTDRINDVDSIRVQSSEETFTLARKDGAWTLEEKQNYPVDEANVRKLLFALRDATTLEPKTDDPERWGQLDVNDPGTEDSKSVQVTVFDASNAQLCALVVGKAVPTKAASGPSLYYARRVDDRPWLVEADLTIDRSSSGWLSKDLLDIDQKRIRSVEIVHPDGGRVHVEKNDPTATDFVLTNLPEGKELNFASVANGLASGLARLTLDDVRTRTDEPLDAGEVTVARFTTFDGLTIEVQSVERDDKVLVQIDATFDPSARPVAPEAPEATPDPEDPDAPPPAVAVPPPAPELKPVAEVRSEAEAIQARTASWTYFLPSWKQAAFQRKLDDMVKDIAPEEPEESGPPLAPSLLDPVPEPPVVIPVDDETDGADD